MTRYQISLKAERLSRGFLRRPSPYAEVSYDNGSLKGQKIGRTETLEATSHPDFVKILFFDADPGRITRVRIVLWDDRGPASEPGRLGEVVVEATEVFQSSGHTQTLPLGGGKSTVSVSVIESNPSHLGYVHLQLRGLDIRNVEPGLLGLGRSDPFFEIAKKDADHQSGQVRWNVIYRSEALHDHLNPYWREFEVGLEELCNGDFSYPIRVAVFDHNKKRAHRAIGFFETTLQHMIDHVAVKGNADREKAYELYREEDVETHGLICVLKAEPHLEKA